MNNTIHVPRDGWETRIYQFLVAVGCDTYGHALKDNRFANDNGGITTEVFEVNPYYWGDDEDKRDIPQFVYRPTGYEMRWYKYPLRGAYATQALTYEEFDEMLEECERFFMEQCK